MQDGADRDGRLASSPKETMQYLLFFNVLFLTLLPQEILSRITYSWDELLDIRVTSTYQHYDQEYNFPEVDPLFGPPLRTMDLIPVADPKQRCRRSGSWSGLLVRLRRRAHHSPLPSIQLAYVQSLDNKVDEIRAMVAFQRDIRDRLCFTENVSLRICCRNRFSHRAFPCMAQTEINTSLGRGRVGVYAS